MTTFTRIAVSTLIGLSLSSYAPANQPRDAGSKARGDIYNFWSAKSGQNHAQDNARGLYYYGQTQQPLAAPQVQQHVTGIRQNLATSQKGLAELKKANSSNKDAQAAIAKIEEIHKKVLGHCDTIDEDLSKEKGTSATVCDCCVDIHDDLEAASVEMNKLMKALKIEALPTPKKVDGKVESKK